MIEIRSIHRCKVVGEKSVEELGLLEAEAA